MEIELGVFHTKHVKVSDGQLETRVRYHTRVHLMISVFHPSHVLHDLVFAEKDAK